MSFEKCDRIWPVPTVSGLLSVCKLFLLYIISHYSQQDMEKHFNFYNTTVIINKEMIREMWVDNPLFKTIEKSRVRVPLSFAFPFYGHDTFVVYIHPRDGVVSLDSEDLHYTLHQRHWDLIKIKFKIIIDRLTCSFYNFKPLSFGNVCFFS